MNPLTREEIIHYVAFTLGESQEEAHRYVKAVLRCLQENIELARPINLYGLFKIDYKVVPKVINWNGKHKYEVPEHLKLTIEAGETTSRALSKIPITYSSEDGTDHASPEPITLT